MSASEAGTRARGGCARRRPPGSPRCAQTTSCSPCPYECCGTARRSLYDPKNAHARALRFRALLEEEEAHEVELALV
jgi:hypothetical protein